MFVERVVRGEGCSWKGVFVEKCVRGKGVFVERGVRGKGCSWKGVFVERGVRGEGCSWRRVFVERGCALMGRTKDGSELAKSWQTKIHEHALIRLALPLGSGGSRW